MARRKKKNSNISVYISVLIIVGVGFLLFGNNLFASIEIPEKPTMPDFRAFWAESDSPYRQEILFDQNASEISFEINHAEMVIDSKSLPSAFDFNIVGQSDTEKVKIDFKIKDPNEIKTQIKFTKQNMFNKYFLYFGNKTAKKNNLETYTASVKINSTLDLEERSQVNINLTKTWILKENSTKSISGTIKTTIDYKQEKIFAVINDNKEKEQNMIIKDSTFEISKENFNIGENSIYIYFVKDSKVYKSNTFKFFYTSPVYVTWTMDWEGTAPDQKYLDSITKISEDFNLPITHFYNPRLYIYLRATDARKNEITNWMVNRIKEGDDIALHIHMQHDLVEEAGVKAKYTEKAWDNGVSGYDTPTTVYSYDEVKKIIAWGKKTLEEKFSKISNFTIPKLQGYRAGGWFANLDTLKAIEDNGFLYDSSGRVPFEIGQNKFTQTWDLLNTSQPYLPSKADQNTSSGINMNLIEVPNNGADSYWSSAQELIANFNANYTSGDFLTSDKLVVYLSHPDWFNIDEPKLKELFKELRKYNNDLDQGPVKYVTIRDYFERSNYIQTISDSLPKN